MVFFCLFLVRKRRKELLGKLPLPRAGKMSCQTAFGSIPPGSMRGFSRFFPLLSKKVQKICFFSLQFPRILEHVKGGWPDPPPPLAEAFASLISLFPVFHTISALIGREKDLDDGQVFFVAFFLCLPGAPMVSWSCGPAFRPGERRSCDEKEDPFGRCTLFGGPVFGCGRLCGLCDPCL